ncbi:T9SS type A sorting domain-containing protein [Hymenobacter sp. YC55]|uniref:T9SS type A sorting domain-containing protein n=1 Tax=Hymenobacter sp. YC55 TaxID=3034019 RepID=UPI0023F955C9|nr:T9SS type A sorting domain-containing protein [Hymenobacter sp. YC55]MDF7810801.1 T9SS type A sorting domain-containing protein [Hymenobacter sp. YC55]
MLHFFSLTEGVVLDRVSGALYRTTDGGISWQLQSTTPVLSAGQFLLSMREASGVLWANVYNVQVQPVAFWASTDRGLTWRSQSIPVAPSGVVFRDAQHALLPTPQGGMLSSTDGGLTWQNATAPPFRLGPLTPIPGTRAYIAGAEHWIGIASDKGSAVTYDDGQTWTILESTNSYQTIQFTAPDAGWHLRASFAAPTTWYEYEGIGRYVGNPLANRAANTSALQLEVFPNPSASGSFTLQLPTAAGRVNNVRVFDTLGRTVYHASALPADQRLDLSQQLKGLYSLEVQTDAGLLRSKVLIE